VTSPRLADVLAAAFVRLDTFPALRAKIGPGRVHNHLPQDCDLPRVRVRWQDCKEWDTKDSDGWQGDIVVDTWSAERGDKAVLDLADIVDDALHDHSLAVATGQAILCQHVEASAFTEPDGLTHHTTSRFRCIVTE
jgi:hypothetical protein